MQIDRGNYMISDDKKLLQIDRIWELLQTTYWAQGRTYADIQTTIQHSHCFGIYKDQVQVGFARCVTDYAVMYWLADGVVAEEHKGQGLGKWLVESVTEHTLLKGLKGFLVTKDAHGLYEQYGFYNDTVTAKRRDGE